MPDVKEVVDTAIEMGGAPYGHCECREGCQCAVLVGPAAWKIKRGNRVMHVCTRCDLSTDTQKSPLPKRGDDLAVFHRYDDLGGFCLQLAIETNHNG